MTSQHQPDHTDQQNPKRSPLTFGEWAAIVAGFVPAAAGAILSWGGMYEAAKEAFDVEWFGALVPIAVDGMIAFGAAGWLASVHAGRRGTAWRSIAHLFVGVTIALNAYAADNTQDVPWHIGGPLAWSLLVEVVAHHVARRRADDLDEPSDRIPLRLWLSAPGESWRTVLRMARTGERSASLARVDADRCELAVLALRRAMPDRKHASDLRMLTRRLAAGSLEPLHVLTVLREGGWIGSNPIGGSDRIESTGSDRIDPQSIVWRCLGSGLEAGSDRPPVDRAAESVAEVDDQAQALDRAAQPLLAIESAPNGSGTRANGHQPAVAAAAQTEPRTVVHETTARQQDLDAIQAAIATGELPAEPSASAIMKALSIGPKYARAARDHITSNGHSGTQEIP